MQTLSFSQLEELLKDYQYFIIDKKVYDLHFKGSFKEKTVYLLNNPEEQKNLRAFEEIASFFLDHEIKRSDVLACIGGGATSDLGGFVASALFRGIKWLAVPTTLLAMVDAAIGGKVGINTQHGKNMLGSFHFPENEFFCSQFLETLEDKDLQSGRGEILKYALLSEKIFKKILNHSSLDSTIRDCIEYKKMIVKEDFKEEGIREVLNLGHTFGHAIEKVYQLPHGIAVVLGIQLNLSLFNPELLSSFRQLLILLKVDLPSLKIEEEKLLPFMKMDKKNKEKSYVRFVTLEEIGKPILKEMDEKELLEKLQRIQK